MIQQGIYEQLITTIINEKLEGIGNDYYIDRQKVDKAEVVDYVVQFLTNVLKIALESIPDGENDAKKFKQIDLANSLIKWLADKFPVIDYKENEIDVKGQLLTALFSKTNPIAAQFDQYVKKVTPQTGLTQSELFTGSNVGLSLESEIKKEIMSSNEIWWLVSFIKWTGIRIFADVLKEATQSGIKLRVISTSYMGATDQRAIDFLSDLQNTEIKMSYLTDRERLHAKAYLFIRNNGFDTGYIGSSNISHAAMTNGLEWNLKVTTHEIPHVLAKFKSSFTTYWESSDFEPYCSTNESHRERLKRSLTKERHEKTSNDEIPFFDIEPHPYQKAILERLHIERTVHHRYRNLIVAATGTGKTVIAAFDFAKYYKENPSCTFLFIAHREEILKQSRASFRSILRVHDFGELWVGQHEPTKYNQLFVSIQTLNNKIDIMNLTNDYYDYIVIDEVHHIAAESYQGVLKQFSPKLLLGLTATPERLDGSDIRGDFCNVIAAELRLPEAINRGYLCPFQYYGISDTVDLSEVKWDKGRYLPSELTRLYTANDQRVNHILRAMQNILFSIKSVKALAFCVSQDHAQYMAEKFILNGISAAVLTSNNSDERKMLRQKLQHGIINFLFVVDIFNEGVDIPEIDTVLFLRPTESLTIFLQQLGRGLRICGGKECLTVLDFVGNANPNYDFSQKFRALIGKSHVSILDEITTDFPNLPLGCSIILEKEAKEVILNNINKAIVNQQRLLQCVRNYSHQTNLPLTLQNFLKLNPHITLDDIYKRTIDNGGGWSRLCSKAGVTNYVLDQNIENAMYRGISKKILQCTSFSYLSFLKNIFENRCLWDSKSDVENQYALMAHYDFWNDTGVVCGFESLEESIQTLYKNEALREELIAVLDHLITTLDTYEKPMHLGFESAITLHARYTKDEILAAFDVHAFGKRSPFKEGCKYVKKYDTELLFVTLQKTEKKFSPTTLYHDYAISDTLFHWQTQNATREDKGKGLSFVNHQKTGKKILLFVREKTEDEYKRTMGFVSIGLVNYVESSGRKPMNIVWRLEEPLPGFLWNDAAKLAIG